METDARLTWSAYEHEHVERSGDWFWALGITAVCIAIASALFGDVLFGLVILGGAGIIALLAFHPPQRTEFEISGDGIRVGRDLHAWDSVISFWVDETGDAPILLVDTVKFLAPNIIIPLDGVEIDAVHALMTEHAEERFMREPIAHKMLEFLGF
jgi:hypothetical protein